MKKSIATIITVFIFSQVVSQQSKTYNDHYAERTSIHVSVIDRNQMLDELRADLLINYKQDFVFEIKELTIKKNYAWLKTEVQRNDGNKIILLDDHSSCCHVEALFKHIGSNWILSDAEAFSNHPWYLDLRSKYSDLPKHLILH